jgi:hypothetical protein
LHWFVAEVGQDGSRHSIASTKNHVHSIDNTPAMIVHQDVDLLYSLQSTRDVSDALETLEQLTTMQQWSDLCEKRG